MFYYDLERFQFNGLTWKKKNTWGAFPTDSRKQ